MNNCNDCRDYDPRDMLCKANLFMKKYDDFPKAIVCLLKQIVQELRFTNMIDDEEAEEDISDWWKKS